MTLAHAETAGIRAKLAGLAKRIESGLQRVLENAVAAAEQVARATTAWKDGTKPGARTRSSIRHSLRGPLSGFVTAAGAAKFLEYGTRPHTITARRAKMLRFVQGGVVRFARTVHHPGTKPTHFMRDAAELVRPIFLRNSVATVNNAIENFNR